MSTQLVVDREDVNAKPWLPLSGYRGVTIKILWDQGESTAGLMRLEAGAEIPDHVHHFAVHHLWVVQGVVGSGGEALGPGSYCYVPAGVEHALTEVGLEGATVFYLTQHVAGGRAAPSPN